MLNQDERNILARQILELSVVYGNYEMSSDKVRIYISALDSFYNLSLEKYLNALVTYSKNSKNKSFPSPIGLGEYLNPEVSDDHQATASASRAIEAVSKFGWCNSQQARDYIGELGWKAVQAFGGWQYVCENLGSELQLTTFNAQIRELSKSIISRSKLGIVDSPVELPFNEKNQPQENNLIQLIKNIKTIEG